MNDDLFVLRNSKSDFEMVELENYINSNSELTKAQKQALLELSPEQGIRPHLAEAMIDVIEFELDPPVRDSAHYQKQKDTIAGLSFEEYDVIADCISIVENRYTPVKGAKRSRYFNAKDAIAGLKRDGIVFADKRLGANTIKSLLETIDRYKFEERMSRDILTGSELREAKSPGTYWLLDLDGFNSEKAIADLALSDEFIDLASMYLGPEAIHVQSNCWLSGASNTSKQHIKRNAQLFHRDQEFLKFLKIFIYLEDVGPEQGPHVYAKGTHIDGDKLFPHQESVSQRFTDKEVASALGGEEAIAMMLGPQGTLLAADTRGFHKGSVVNSGQRIMLQFEYAVSLYGSPVEHFSLGKLAKGQANLRGRRVIENYRENPVPVPALSKKKKTLSQKLVSRLRRWTS